MVPRMVETLQQDGSAERERLRALAATGLVGTAPEQEFDDLALLARGICGTAYSLVTFVTDSQVHIKAAIGMPLCGAVPREQALCNSTMQQEGIFAIPDLLVNEQYCEHPLVTGGLRLRFYAGVRLHGEGGHPLGTLCVLDTEPRTLTEQQQAGLLALGRQAEAQLQLRARMGEQSRLAADLASQQEILQMFLDSLPMEAYAKREDGTVLFYNRKVAEKFGVSRTEWIGKRSSDLWDAKTAETIRLEEEWVLQTNRPHEVYMELPTAGGAPGYWKVIKSPLRLHTGERLLTGVAMDLTAELRREAELQKTQDNLEEANRKLRSLALTDNLTSLWNRRAFDAELETGIFRAQRGQQQLTLLMLDVDNFKQLNDCYGHTYGDQVLQQVSQALRHAVRTDDFVARYGGEEFALLLPGTDGDGGKRLCARIRNAMKRMRWQHRPVTVSIGIAVCLPGTTGDELLNMADEAMYQAKRNGKDCAVLYQVEEEMLESTAA